MQINYQGSVIYPDANHLHTTKISYRCDKYYRKYIIDR